jgi:acyl carrier protein
MLNVESFYANLAEIMEIDEIREHDVLRDFPEWDSLTALSLIASVRSQYSLTLHASDLREIRTAKDLRDLIAAKQAS